METVTHEYFEGFVGQSFQARAGDQSVTLLVTEVQLLPPPRRRSLTGKVVEMPVKRAPFSVYFRSEGELRLTQGVFQVEPPDGGEPLDIFLVPLGVEEGGALYEAVFN